MIFIVIVIAIIIVAVVMTGQWKEASRQRELLLAYLQRESGVGTLLDTRRIRDYDADNLVDQYLNLKDVQVSSGFQTCHEAYLMFSMVGLETEEMRPAMKPTCDFVLIVIRVQV